jgi:hypothetical protein
MIGLFAIERPKFARDLAGGLHPYIRYVRGGKAELSGGKDLVPDDAYWGLKISSMLCLKSFAIKKASGRLGSYLPVSIALTV